MPIHNFPMKCALTGYSCVALCAAVGLSLAGCTEVEDDDDSAATEELLPFDPEIADRLDAALNSIVIELGPPGAQAAFRVPGHELWIAAAGVSDLETQAALEFDHLLKAGSITKTATASVVLDQVDSGVVILDEPVSSYWYGLDHGDEITIRQLLNHTSGLPDYTGYIDTDDLCDEWTPAELVALVAQNPLDFPPGSAWAYSNTNYIVLSLVIESITGDVWYDVVDAVITEAIGPQSGASIPGPDEGWPGVQPGYMLLDDGTPYEYGGEINYLNFWHNTAVGAAGNMISDPASLALWGAALWGGELLTDEQLQLQATDAVEVSSTISYGLGAAYREDDYGKEVWHNGALNGYVAWLGHRAETGVTLAFLSNAWFQEGSTFDPSWSTEAADRLWDAYYDGD